MKFSMTLKVEIDRSKLALSHWTKAFPVPAVPAKAADVKDDDPAWLAVKADYEAKKTLHARAVSAELSAQALAVRYLELIGWSTGSGSSCPLVYTMDFKDASSLEAAKNELREWADKSMGEAKEIYKKAGPTQDFMAVELARS